MKTSHCLDGITQIKIAGEEALLLPQKAIYLIASKTLVVADVHIGKAASFRKRNFFAPDGMTERDLGCLTAILEHYQAERLIILGDLVHAQDGLTPEETSLFDAFRQLHMAREMVLILGNHDRRARLPSSWKLEQVKGLMREGAFVFAHEYAEQKNHYVLSGHIHPAVVLRGTGKQRERLPCFWLRHKYAVLPSFGVFTGSYAIRPSALDKIFVIAHDSVIPMPLK